MAVVALAAAFVAWWLYVTYLGLKSFFGKGKNRNKGRNG